MQGFAGFPAGKLATTPVPNLFFSELLPLVDNLAELKIILHLFWLIGKKRGKLRYARLDELLRDRLLIDALTTPKSSGEAVLRDALERAVVARCTAACHGRTRCDDRRVVYDQQRQRPRGAGAVACGRA